MFVAGVRGRGRKKATQAHSDRPFLLRRNLLGLNVPIAMRERQTRAENRNSHYYYYWLLNSYSLVGRYNGKWNCERLRVLCLCLAFSPRWAASWLFIIISCVVAVETNRAKQPKTKKKQTKKISESNLIWVFHWQRCEMVVKLSANKN